MVRPGERVLVAVSGGADSIGWLAILHQVRRRLGIELLAAHVNHALRGADSDADELCAAEAATRLTVPFVRCSLAEVLEPGGNLEERAREFRYAALARLAAENGCAKIATGHTEDDQAETLLLRLIRGSGPSGLAAIRPRRDDGVIRPLIECQRADVARVVRELGLEHRHDRTNDDPRHLRTQVRHRVLPLLHELNPAIVGTLARTATLERDDAALIDRWVEEQGLQRGSRIAVADLLALPAALRARVARRWLEENGIGRRGLTARHLDSVLALTTSSRPSGAVQLPGDRQVRRRGEVLVLGALAATPGADPTPLLPGDAVLWPGGWRFVAEVRERAGGDALPADLWSAACAADDSETPLTVRCPRRGERVRPLGLGGSRKLSDVFIDRRVPADERAGYPVVVCRDEIVWVPGVVRAESLCIGPRTRRMLSLRAERTVVS